MQEHKLLYRAADCYVLYLGDAAHGMVPTLGAGRDLGAGTRRQRSRHHRARLPEGKHEIESCLCEIEARFCVSGFKAAGLD
jgi:salicylate hydroxylase